MWNMKQQVEVLDLKCEIRSTKQIRMTLMKYALHFTGLAKIHMIEKQMILNM
jgi:hypothetical protein